MSAIIPSNSVPLKCLGTTDEPFQEGGDRPSTGRAPLMSEHVARNRAYWDDLARQYVEAGERAWAQKEPGKRYGG